MSQCTAQKENRTGGIEYCLLDEHKGNHKWPTPKKGRVCHHAAARIERLRQERDAAIKGKFSVQEHQRDCYQKLETEVRDLRRVLGVAEAALITPTGANCAAALAEIRK